MEPQLTYEQALERLKKIVADIEQGNVSIDKLSEKVSEAKKLFEFCQARLTNIEDEVTDILKNLPYSLDENGENL